MNRNLGTPIHETNLEHGQTYYLKTHWGEGAVTYVENQADGYLVEIIEGGFRPPLRKYGKGNQMLVNNGTGTWYEMK